MRLFFFGSIGDRLGREAELDWPGGTVAALRDRLAERYPEASDLILSPTIRAVVGDVMADEEMAVGPQDEVAFFPPLSGG